MPRSDEYEYYCYACEESFTSTRVDCDVCSTCGGNILTELCPMCGATIDSDTKVCPVCKEVVK
jgi:rRNA maturation endonuclease Nob1